MTGRPRARLPTNSPLRWEIAPLIYGWRLILTDGRTVYDLW